MSPAVIYGMLAGIGVLIAGAQFHVMLDAAPKPTGWQNLISIPAAIIYGVFPLDRSPHEAAAVSGLTTIIAMFLWERFRPNALRLLPAALIGLLSAIAVIKMFGLTVQYVTVPANLLAALQIVDGTSLAALTGPTLLFAALGISVIASAETLLSAAAIDRMQPGSKADYDRELSAQGIGNAVCGAIGALPMTGVIVRSSTNVRAGATTRWSTTLHGLWLLLATLIGAPLLAQIPTSALAAVLVLTGIKLVDVVPIRRLRQYGWMPLVIYGATIAGIVGLDLLKGVLIGVALTLANLIYQASRLEVWLEKGPETGRYDLTLVGSATFLRMPAISAALDQVPPGAILHLHAERVIDLDHPCLDLLVSWDEQQSLSGGRLLVDWEDLRSRFHQPGSTQP
jgi:MFS superfamily sulfate permease-like transporter